MSFSLLSVFVLLLLAVTVAIEIYRGINRGFMKTLISFATVILSLIMSVIFSPIFGRFVADIVYYNISRYYQYKEMIQGFEFVDSLIQPVLGIVISVVFFVVVFFVIRALLGTLMLIVYRLIPKIFNKGFVHLPESVDKEPGESWIRRNERVLSIVTGGLSAFIISIAITSPIMGIFNVTQDLLDIAVKWNYVYFQQEEIAEVVEEVEKYTKDIPGNVLYYSGGEFIFRGIARVEYNEENLSFIDELETVEEAANNFLAVYPVMVLGDEPTESTYQRIDMLCDCVMDVKICKPVLAFYGSMGAEAWLKDYLIFGIRRPQLNKIAKPTFDELLRVCATSTEENIQMNMVTMLKVYSIILQSDLDELSTNMSYEKLLAELEANGIVERLLSEIEKNPQMESVEKSAKSILVDLVVENINALEISVDSYDVLMKNIADGLNNIKEKGYRTREEQILVMTATLKDCVGDYGVVIPDDIMKYTAEMIWDNFKENKYDISKDDMVGFFAEQRIY